MPRKYTALRDKFKRQGMSDKGAKKKAAKIYNAKRGGKKPVTRKTGDETATAEMKEGLHHVIDT